MDDGFFPAFPECFQNNCTEDVLPCFAPEEEEGLKIEGCDKCKTDEDCECRVTCADGYRNMGSALQANGSRQCQKAVYTGCPHWKMLKWNTESGTCEVMRQDS